MKSIVLHNGGLASGVALAMTTRMHNSEEITVMSTLEFDKTRLEAIGELNKHLGIGKFVHQFPDKLIQETQILNPKLAIAELVLRAVNKADRVGAKEVVLGSYSKVNTFSVDGEKYKQIHFSEALYNLVSTVTNGRIQLRMPLIDLSLDQVACKAVDLELPLDLTRNCVTSEEKFCGICNPCRIRIEAFKKANLMDYDYSIDIDWELAPADRAEFQEWLEDNDGLE